MRNNVEKNFADINFLVFFLGLRIVKRELLNALQTCRTNECKQVQKDYEIGRLDENNIDYDKVSRDVASHKIDS